MVNKKIQLKKIREKQITIKIIKIKDDIKKRLNQILRDKIKKYSKQNI